MLAVLAVHSPAAVTRERIAAIFWGDLAEERARHSLRQVLTALRRDAAIVEASGETLRLDARVCTADAAEFATLAASTDPGELERAVALHAGAFSTDCRRKTKRSRSGWAPSARGWRRRRWKP